MAEEFRFFARTGLYVAVAGVVYWLVSQEEAGTVLLGALLLAVVAFVSVGLAMAPRAGAAPRGGGPLGAVNRLIGFHDPPDVSPPFEAGSELIPLASPWPVVTAGAMILVGLGFIFGSWLTVPGVVLLAIGGFGWLTQLD